MRGGHCGGVHQNSLGALTLRPLHHHRTQSQDARSFDQIAVRYVKDLENLVFPLNTNRVQASTATTGVRCPTLDVYTNMLKLSRKDWQGLCGRQIPRRDSLGRLLNPRRQTICRGTPV